MNASFVSAPLAVRLFDRLAGHVSVSGPMRSPEDWAFIYEGSYLAAANPVPLSVSLPLRAEPFSGSVVRNWFCNLLPEGAVRDAIEARLRLPARDDFALLVAIGGECAGAVSVGDRTAIQAPDDEDTDLETLLYLQGGLGGDGSWATLAAPRRLSLAGAQDKIAVVRDSDGRLRLPQRGEPSTHILKPDSRRLPGLRDLEAMGLSLARAVGLTVAPAELAVVAGARALLVTRYDRRPAANGGIERLHQEDFCQALGYPAELKYESHGGPSLARCSHLLRDLRLGPAAVQGLLDWVAFCAVIGNADAHAKNLALLCGPDGVRRLAPFYDLVPTIALPESLVDRAPALRIGTATRIDAIDDAAWTAFARDAGYAPRFVRQRVADLAEQVLAHLSDVADLLVTQGADEAGIRKRALPAIRANAQGLSGKA